MAPPADTAPRLTPRQRRAALALAAGATVKQAAAEVGCGERTLKTWRADPTFAAAVEAEASAIIVEHRASVRKLLVEAVKCAFAALEGDNGPALAVRLLSAPHLAAFAGGGAPGSTKCEVEHSGALAAGPPREIVLTVVHPPERDEDGNVIGDPGQHWSERNAENYAAS